MTQILIHITGVVLAALVVKVLRLNTKRLVVSHTAPVSWVWKAVALLGKIFFWYGLVVFVSNLMLNGAAAPNTGVGAMLLTVGFVLWVVGGLIVYFKRN